MDKDEIQGSVEQAKGKVKEVAGEVTGDANFETEGKTQQVARGPFRMRSAASRTRSRKLSKINDDHLHNVRNLSWWPLSSLERAAGHNVRYWHLADI